MRNNAFRSSIIAFRSRAGAACAQLNYSLTARLDEN